MFHILWNQWNCFFSGGFHKQTNFKLPSFHKPLVLPPLDPTQMSSSPCPAPLLQYFLLHPCQVFSTNRHPSTKPKTTCQKMRKCHDTLATSQDPKSLPPTSFRRNERNQQSTTKKANYHHATKPHRNNISWLASLWLTLLPMVSLSSSSESSESDMVAKLGVVGGVDGLLN